MRLVPLSSAAASTLRKLVLPAALRAQYDSMFRTLLALAHEEHAAWKVPVNNLLELVSRCKFSPLTQAPQLNVVFVFAGHGALRVNVVQST